VTGIDLITKERLRQVEVEGYRQDHDRYHTQAELVRAAICYARLALHQTFLHVVTDDEVPPSFEGPPREWPWSRADWKPDPDPTRNLAKAGALLAAEIDRVDIEEGPHV
jgi:hypothetical protein